MTEQKKRISPWLLAGRVIFTFALIGCITFILSAVGLKVGNVFAINELRQAMPRWPNNKVFGVLGLLREYDGKSKGLDAGGASDGELLRELLLKMLTI